MHLRPRSNDSIHRNTLLVEEVEFGDGRRVEFRVNGTTYFIARLQGVEGWWGVVMLRMHEERFEDIGPFETPEAAYATLRFMS